MKGSFVRPDRYGQPGSHMEEPSGSVPANPRLETPTVGGLLAKIGIYGLGSVLSQALSYVGFLIYAGLLSTQDFGIVAVALVVSSLVTTVGHMSLPGAINVAFYQLTAEERRRYCGTVALAVLFWSLFVAGLATSVGLWVTPRLFQQVPFSPYLVLAIWSGFFVVFSSLPLNLSLVQFKAKTYAAFLLVQGVLQLGITVGLLLAFEGNAYYYLLGTLLSQAVMAGLFVTYTIRHADLSFSVPMLADALKLALPLAPHQAFLRATGMVDRVVLERFVPLSELGLYAFGSRVASVVSGFSGFFSQGLGPLIYQRGKDEAFRAQIARMATYLSLGALSVSLAVALLAPDLIELVGLRRYRGAESSMQLLSLGLALHAFYLIPNSYLFMNRKSYWIPVISGVGAGAAVLANLVLVPRYGIQGAAFAAIAMYGTMAVAGQVLMLSQAEVPLRYEPRLWRGVVVVAVAGAVARLFTAQLDPGVLRLVIRAAVILSLCAGGLVALRFFDDAEKRAASAALRRLLRLRPAGRWLGSTK